MVYVHLSVLKNKLLHLIPQNNAFPTHNLYCSWIVEYNFYNWNNAHSFSTNIYLSMSCAENGTERDIIHLVMNTKNLQITLSTTNTKNLQIILSTTLFLNFQSRSNQDLICHYVLPVFLYKNLSNPSQSVTSPPYSALPTSLSPGPP